MPDQFLHIGLVACSRTKANSAAPARQLYVSPLFRVASAYAQRHYSTGRWFILSALHGLVDPDTVLAPYDLSLRQLSPREREAWGDRVAVELTDRFPAGTWLASHAALNCYRRWLRVPLLRFGHADLPPACHQNVDPSVVLIGAQRLPMLRAPIRKRRVATFADRR